MKWVLEKWIIFLPILIEELRGVIVGCICSSETYSKAVIKGTKMETVMSYYNEL
jgi:hypothetical protein